MLKELEDYNWAEVFGEGDGGSCTPTIPDRPPGDKTHTRTFYREDVATIRGQVEGDRDEADWIVWGQLKDGRWFFASGGCDNTGWDCTANNDSAVASNEADLIRYSMTDYDRERFGLSLPGATR